MTSRRCKLIEVGGKVLGDVLFSRLTLGHARLLLQGFSKHDGIW